MMPFVFFSTTQDNLCSIHNLQYLILLTLPENLGGGENRKTEIQNEGVGGGFLFMYLSTIICNGGQRGWGSWGVPLCLACPCLAVLASRSLLTFLALHPNVRNLRFLLVEFTHSIIQQSVTARGGRIQQTARIGLV